MGDLSYERIGIGTEAAPAPPAGVDLFSLDKVTNLLPDGACPETYTAAFLEGTAPTDPCSHLPEHRNFLQKILGLGENGN
jgi:penicillin-binding protein 1B